MVRLGQIARWQVDSALDKANVAMVAAFIRDQAHRAGAAGPPFQSVVISLKARGRALPELTAWNHSSGRYAVHHSNRCVGIHCPLVVRLVRRDAERHFRPLS